jgi:hypothetical protein
VTPEGNLTDYLNELAFAPVDYRENNSPKDEWSGDEGVGAMFFSQQAVGRLAPAAGFVFGDSMPLPERLKAVQQAMSENDARAAEIYRAIGIALGYTMAHYAEFYEVNNLLLLGRVSSGEGGSIMLDTARKVLAEEFPELKIEFHLPDETFKRHGQAVVAATI